MLSDERARFSVKDIGLIVGFTASFALAYSSLKQADAATGERIASVERQLASRDLSSLPTRMTRLEYLICATDDKARALACERMRVLR